MKRVENITLTLNNGKEMEFEVYIDLRSMTKFEQDYYDLYKKESSFMTEVDKITKTQSMTGIALLVGATLHKPNQKYPVGIEFVMDHVDIMQDIQVIMDAVGKCMMDLQPRTEQPKGK